MTNRQSNIIFYSIISIIIYAIIIDYAFPDFFEDFTKGKKELSIKEAMNKGEHNKALTLYQKLVVEKINSNSEKTAETATIYEDIANVHSLLGNREKEKEYYLKSLEINEQLKNPNTLNITHIYDKLGSFAEEEKKYDQAQMYYEKSLSKKLGDIAEEDEGLFVGMQNSRERYLRLNNEETIKTFKKLAKIHNIKREYTIAKKYYEKALTASKLTFGEDDSKTLEIMNLMNRLVL